MTAQRDLDAVVRAYAECALWASLHYDDCEDSGETVPMDAVASVEDIAAETWERFRKDCARMVEYADGTTGADWWDDEQLGHDLWLTRNGHGTGFWDRGQGLAGTNLTHEATWMGECDLYLGDDGKVYAS